MTDTGWERTGAGWTPADVDAVAYSMIHSTRVSMDLLMRLGPNPPDDFLEALGKRVLEWSTGERAPDLDIKGHQ